MTFRCTLKPYVYICICLYYNKTGVYFEVQFLVIKIYNLIVKSLDFFVPTCKGCYHSSSLAEYDTCVKEACQCGYM